MREKPYYAITVEKTTNCLHLENTVYVDLDGKGEQFLSIAKAVFQHDKLNPNKWFSIPQYIYIYCTERVVEKINKTDLMGFEFTFI